VFVNANDGMLHAFRASDGQEQFAYIPGFIVPRLNSLSNPDYTHRRLLDSTPSVGEAQLNGQWRSVLVSGAGAGAQGIYALDVTEPDAFTKDKVLWEFTDADHPAMGNVLGKPRIARVRMNDAGSGNTSYKWMAVVASGVNNHRNDASTNRNSNPSIFLLDLEANPKPSAPWRESVNFWRIELPPGTTATAPGVIEINTVKTFGSQTLESIVAGDLQGNVWQLSFSQKGVSSLGVDGLVNLATLNAMGANQNPLFTAQASDGSRQPISSAPLVANAFAGKRLIVVGTGKFLEAGDNMSPSSPANSVYALLAGSGPITHRSALQGATVDAQGVVSASPFVLGDQSGQKKGWFIDLPATTGERQVTEMLLDRGRLVFSTLIPVGGACGEGGGRLFDMQVLSGRGAWRESTVGLLGGPMLLNQGNAMVSASNTAGRRTATYRINVMTQGAKGVEVGGVSQQQAQTVTLQVGRMSWRRVNNFNDLVP